MLILLILSDPSFLWLSEIFPVTEHHCLTSRCAMRINNVPHRGALDTEAPTGGGDANTAVIVNEATAIHALQQVCALLAFHRFRRQARGHGGKIRPAGFEQPERRAIGVIKYRIGLNAMRSHYERCFVKCPRLLRR